MIETLKKRVAREESGFTLIELLVVIIILGILLAIAVPSYLSFKDRANKSAAQANIRSVIPDIESWNADNYPGSPNDPDGVSNTGYEGMTPTLLQSQYDRALDPAKYTLGLLTQTNYCVFTQQGNFIAFKHGPSGTIGAVDAADFVPGSCA